MERLLGTFDSGRKEFGMIRVYYDLDLQCITMESEESGRVLHLTEKEAMVLFEQLDSIANYNGERIYNCE